MFSKCANSIIFDRSSIIFRDKAIFVDLVESPLFLKKIFFHHTTCESTCDTLASSAANQGDNTVSVAQGGTATPGATEQLLPPDRVFKRNIYLCIHKIN